MYGTVAKIKVKPGNADAFKAYMDVENRDIPGALDIYVYQTDADETILYLAVIFSDKEAYASYSESPESHTRFEKMMPLLESEPEWNDGTVLFHRQF